MESPTTTAPTAATPTTTKPTITAPPSTATLTATPPAMEPLTAVPLNPAPPTMTSTTFTLIRVHHYNNRKSVTILGWSLLIFSPFYLILGCLVCGYCLRGNIGNAKESLGVYVYAMTFLYGAFKFSLGVMLRYAAAKESVRILTVSRGLTLFVGIYAVLLGTLGLIFFFVMAHYTFNFLMGLTYLFIAFSILEMLCVDVVIIEAYRMELTGRTL